MFLESRPENEFPGPDETDSLYTKLESYKMKIQVLSDLHLEFNDYNLEIPSDVDLIVLAGDIHIGANAFSWIHEKIGNKIPVIYVLGNHEYYRRHIFFSDGIETMKIHRELSNVYNVHILENDSVVIDGVRFVGCTLWTDMNVHDNSVFAEMNAPYEMNDYQLCHFSQGQILRPQHTIEAHKKSVKYLRNTILGNQFDGKTVVVTHHLPSEKSCFPEFQNFPIRAGNAYFASNLDNLVANSDACLWIHGHTHNPRDYKIGNTRIVCNPRGYLGREANNGFVENLVIEV